MGRFGRAVGRQKAPRREILWLSIGHRLKLNYVFLDTPSGAGRDKSLHPVSLLLSVIPLTREVCWFLTSLHQSGLGGFS